MKLELVDYNSPLLKQRAEEVVEYGKELKDLISEMEEIMFAKRGVGISAPQVGVSQRVMILFDGEKRLMHLVNPEVISQDSVEQLAIEGCLTYPNLYLGIKRPFWVNLRWRTSEGEAVIGSLDGLLARIFWHELDHLNGVTLKDRVSNLKWSRWVKERKKDQINPLTGAAR